MTVADDILAATVRHAVYVERYKARLVRDILKLVKGAEGGIQEELLRADLQRLGRRDLARLLSRIEDRINNDYLPVAALLDTELRGLSAYESQWQLDMFRRVIPLDFDYTSPAPEQIYAATVARPFNGRLLREWYQDLPAGQFRRVRAAIRMGFVDGRTTAQIVQEIIGTRTTPGIIQRSRRGAETAVRTAVAHTANVARNETYRANRRLIKGIEWVSTLDGRTSMQCMALDGRVFPIDKGPRPPIHPNCRSSTIPSLRKASELGLKDIPAGTRASMNGQVSAELNYNAWLQTQSRAFQDDVLGPTRADLFRSGVAVDRFVDNSGRQYTLDQLRERESAAWAESGL